MQIRAVKVGELRTNCYLVFNEPDNEALVIDPGSDLDLIVNKVDGLKIKAIVLTHGHFDHVTDAFKLKEMTGAPVMIHEFDEPIMVLSTHHIADRHLHDGDTITVDSMNFKVIHTPGHSPGGICLYNEEEKVLFSGDTLFLANYGRTDLPGSSQSEMEKSLSSLFKLPPETEVYPGHGKPTTIGEERNLLK